MGSLLTSSASSSLASSLRTVGRCLTTTSKRNQHFIWCCVCVVANSELAGQLAPQKTLLIRHCCHACTDKNMSNSKTHGVNFSRPKLGQECSSSYCCFVAK